MLFPKTKGCEYLLEIEKVGGYERIYQVDCFEKEFLKTTSEKNLNGRYHRWLRQKLYSLDDFINNPLNPEDFEPLQSTNPKLFSIRYPRSKKNPRVLYIYVGKNQVYLLHAFKESKKSDYVNAIKIAESRAKLFI